LGLGYISWVDVARMRDHLAHRYFDTVYGVIAATVAENVPPLVAAVKRLLDRETR